MQFKPEDQSSWAVHFPGNLRWSNAMQIVKGMVPYAAVAMAEVDRIGQRLAARAGERSRSRLARGVGGEADRVAAVADQAAAEGREITAGNHYMRAGNYYYSAERFIPPGADKMAMYRKALRCYQAAMRALASRHRARRGALRERQPAAYFVKAPGRGRAPDRGAVRRHGQRQGDERHLRGPRFRQARDQHARDRRARPGRNLAAAQHPQPARLRGAGHRRLRLRRRTRGG